MNTEYGNALMHMVTLGNMEAVLNRHNGNIKRRTTYNTRITPISDQISWRDGDIIVLEKLIVNPPEDIGSFIKNAKLTITLQGRDPYLVPVQILEYLDKHWITDGGRLVFSIKNLLNYAPIRKYPELSGLPTLYEGYTCLPGISNHGPTIRLIYNDAPYDAAKLLYTAHFLNTTERNILKRIPNNRIRTRIFDELTIQSEEQHTVRFQHNFMGLANGILLRKNTTYNIANFSIFLNGTLHQSYNTDILDLGCKKYGTAVYLPFFYGGDMNSPISENCINGDETGNVEFSVTTDGAPVDLTMYLVGDDYTVFSEDLSSRGVLSRLGWNAETARTNYKLTPDEALMPAPAPAPVPSVLHDLSKHVNLGQPDFPIEDLNCPITSSPLESKIWRCVMCTQIINYTAVCSWIENHGLSCPFCRDAFTDPLFYYTRNTDSTAVN